MKKLLLLLLPLAIVCLGGCTSCEHKKVDCLVLSSYNENYRTFSDRYIILDCNGTRETMRSDIYIEGDYVTMYLDINTGNCL